MDTKYKMGFIVLYIIELMILLSGPKFIAIVLLIVTTIAYFLLSEHDKEIEVNSNIKNIVYSLNGEIELLKKSSKRFNSKIYDKNIIEIESNIGSLIEKYSFIRNSYGLERGRDSLEQIEKKFKNLEINLKQVNDSLLKLYTSSESQKDSEITNQLSQIIDELDAHISLEER